MSREDFEELKRKHRAAECRAMVKADMDYLKGLLKHMQEKSGAVQGLSVNAGMSVSNPAGLIFAASADTEPEIFSAGTSPSSVDIAI
jgi:hypothetical protein